MLNFSERGDQRYEWPKITGINIIDDMLFWTDGYTEPRKINIPDSKRGTSITNGMWVNHTNLVINNIAMAFTPVLKKHITVIRKNPPLPPTLEMSNTTRQGVVTSTATFDFQDSNTNTCLLYTSPSPRDS